MTGSETDFWENLLLGSPGCEGESYTLSGRKYVHRDGVLRQLDVYTPSQAQTGEAFGFKWARRDTYESDELKSAARRWLVDRYLGGDPTRLLRYFPDGCRVLDAGCGSGYSALLLLEGLLERIRYLGVDISAAVDIARQRFAESGVPGEFIQADFTKLPFDTPVFDAVLAEGTLHHTDSTREAIGSLAGRLVRGGHFLFYVYRRKGPIREFTDDFIRDQLQRLKDAEAWDALMPLTKLGKALGDLHATVEVPEEIPFLGIPAGEIDVQRLFYWHVFKAFYRPNLALDEMNHVNFDWYRPLNAFRQTPEEVRAWCTEFGFTIARMDVQEAGITVVARKD